MFLVRRISRSKCAPETNEQHGFDRNEASADAVTADLRTLGNRLAFWKCDSVEVEDEEKVALAIVAASDNIETTYVVWTPTSVRQADGLDWIDSDGRTRVADLSSLHVDVCHLYYRRLGKLAECVRQAVEGNRYNRLKDAICQAYRKCGS